MKRMKKKVLSSDSRLRGNEVLSYGILPIIFLQDPQGFHGFFRILRNNRHFIIEEFRGHIGAIIEPHPNPVFIYIISLSNM